MMEEGRTGSRDFTVVITDPGPGPVVIQPALTEFRRAVEMERLLDLVGQTLADSLRKHPGVEVRAAFPSSRTGSPPPSLYDTAVDSDPAPNWRKPGITSVGM